MSELELNTVLLIEPDPALADHSSSLLNQAGLSVVRAQGHLQGLALFDDSAVDIALVPLEATDIDGFEFCRLVRRREREQRRRFTYIILLADRSQRERIFETEVEAEDFVIVPCLDDELVWRIQAGLGLLRRLETAVGQLRFDPETQILNRNGLTLCLQDEVNRAARRETRLSIVLLRMHGLDLAELNYGSGWMAWFEERLFNAVRESLRNYDSVARIARNALCLVLPDTDQAGLGSVMDRVEVEVDRVLQSFPEQDLPDVQPELCGLSLDVRPEYKGIFEAVENLTAWIEKGFRAVWSSERLSQGTLGRSGIDLR